MIRTATTDDVAYLARAFAGVAKLLKQVDGNPFVAELPDGAAASAEIAATFISDAARFALIAQRADTTAGCLAALVGPPSVDWSQLTVGHIVCCWVEPSARKSGIARELTTAAEQEFKRRNVEHVELAYIVGNTDAAQAWARLGYLPHRVFALKHIQSK